MDIRTDFKQMIIILSVLFLTLWFTDSMVTKMGAGHNIFAACIVFCAFFGVVLSKFCCSEKIQDMVPDCFLTFGVMLAFTSYLGWSWIFYLFM